MNHKKIKKNFLLIANYNNDISWVPEYTDDYLIYDQSEEFVCPPGIDPTKVVKMPHLGYNFLSYFRFIADHYDSLPETTVFAKGNCFPRHMSRAFFEERMNCEGFTPIMDETMCKAQMPNSFIENGFYHEINNSWYFCTWKNKYFCDFNDFLRYVYKDPEIPEYTKFILGATYVLPKKTILRLPKKLYEDMIFFLSHCATPAEAHMIERACCTLWTSDQKFNGTMLTQPVEDFVPNIPVRFVMKKAVKRSIDFFMSSSWISDPIKNNASHTIRWLNAIRSHQKTCQIPK